MFAKFTQICKRTCLQNSSFTNKASQYRAYSSYTPKKGLDGTYKKNVINKQLDDIKIAAEQKEEGSESSYESALEQNYTRDQALIGLTSNIPYYYLLKEWFTNELLLQELIYVQKAIVLHALWNSFNYCYFQYNEYNSATDPNVKSKILQLAMCCSTICFGNAGASLYLLSNNAFIYPIFIHLSSNVIHLCLIYWAMNKGYVDIVKGIMITKRSMIGMFGWIFFVQLLWKEDIKKKNLRDTISKYDGLSKSNNNQSTE